MQRLNKLLFIFHKLRAITRVARNEVVKYSGQLYPQRPTVLNLLINDICNSRCMTCSIWQRKREHEISPSELQNILADSLFKRLQYIGVSGGEPTLRPDLGEIFNVLCTKEPKLRGTGIITNALRPMKVIEQVESALSVCRKHGVPFNLMISLDGIGEVHNRVRGIKGNFEAVIKVLQHFQKSEKIPLSIGFTASKLNAWEADNVLRFCREQNIYGRFRIAEYIDRLANNESDIIRNFSPEEAYNLALFFFKLEYQYESSETIKRTYRNIREMLSGQHRSIGCQWQSTAVTLDSRGHLSYCAPKSPVLESCINNSAERIYKANISKRNIILKEKCATCIHDYHDNTPLGISELLVRRRNSNLKKSLSIENALNKSHRISAPTKLLSKMPESVLIVGWYGTETAGDKAILWSIVHGIRTRSPNAKITIASLYPFITKWTVRELDLTDVELVYTYSSKFIQECSVADEIVMGGGPLMQLGELGLILYAFTLACKAGHITRIEGCGIGPVSKEPYLHAVKEILRLSSVINLRDSDSVRWAEEYCNRTDASNTGDPAVVYIKNWLEVNDSRDEKPILGCYLREWPAEYRGSLSEEEFGVAKVKFENELGNLIKRVCKRMNLRPRFLPMHHFVIGNDDRDFNRRFAEEQLEGLEPMVEKRPVSPAYILETMQSSPLNICMRFHSVLFASALGRPFIAIDYTNGGKIKSFLTDSGGLNNMIDMNAMAKGSWLPPVDSIIDGLMENLH